MGKQKVEIFTDFQTKPYVGYVLQINDRYLIIEEAEKKVNMLFSFDHVCYIKIGRKTIKN